MTRSRKKRPVPQTDHGSDRRRWRNNLPYGPALRPQWTAEEREAKLRRRQEFVKTALTVLVSIGSTSGAWYFTTSKAIGEVQLNQATMESRFTSRLDSMQKQLDRLENYFGVPSPRNPGR